MALNNQQKSALRHEIEKQHLLEHAALLKAKCINKSEFRNQERYMNKQRREQEEDADLLKYQNRSAQRETFIQGEERLAAELGRIKRDDLKELKMRQWVRENSPELKELELQLRTAYITKELKAQLEEKEAEKLNKKIKDQHDHELLIKARIEEKELREIELRKVMLKKAKYRQELQDQMIVNEKCKRFEYEEFLREKKMIDDIIQRIHDENEREIQERMCKMQKTREEIEMFKRAQEIWKKKKCEEIEEENRQIQEYLDSKSTDIKQQQEEKERKEAEKQRIIENISKKMCQAESERKEREYIIQELLEEENNQAIDQRFKDDVEKLLRSRIEVRTSLKQQMHEHEEQIRKEAERDALYKKQMLEKLAEADKLEQMSDAKKRLKMTQYRKDVEAMMIERRQKYAEEMQLNMKLLQKEAEDLEKKKKIVEEERRKLLQEHAKNLIGYLPKRVLREDDLPYLDCEVYKSYTKKH